MKMDFTEGCCAVGRARKSRETQADAAQPTPWRTGSIHPAEHFLPGTFEGLSEPGDYLDGRVGSAVFNSLQVRPVDVGLFAQPFLSDPEFCTKPGHIASEGFAGRHGTKPAGRKLHRPPHICGFLLVGAREF
jgi:hypothetical protein